MKYVLTALVAALHLTGMCATKQEVKFKRGESSASVAGNVIRGERDQYTIGAGQGQYLSLTMLSLENNAVFDVYQPGFKVSAEGDVQGQRLNGASGVTRFTGQLPVKGQYLIVVGGTRGNADYKLSVGITAEPPTSAAVKEAIPPKAAQPETPPAGKSPSLVGSWICNEGGENRPTAFFSDGTFMLYSAQDRNNHVFASGIYQFQGNRLEMVRALGMTIRQSDGAVLAPWGQSPPGKAFGMTNFLVLSYQISGLDATKLLRTRLRVSTGPGGESENESRETNCVRSERHFVLENHRQAVPASLYDSLRRVMGR